MSNHQNILHVSRPVEQFLKAVEQATGRARQRSGTGWSCLCPSHKDRTPSLSVSEGDAGRVLLRCHAGCDHKSILEALDLSEADLFAEPLPDRSRHHGNGHSKPAATNGHKPKTHPTADAAVASLRLGPPSRRWTYKNAYGQPAGEVLRWDGPDGKTIRPLARGPSGWSCSAMPEPRPLLNLPELLAAEPSRPVLVVEGEKCCDAAASLGFLSATSAGGAQAAGKTDWSPLAGRTVWLLPDNDDAGRKYAETVAATLTSLSPPATVKLVELPNLPAGGDIVDWLASRKGLPASDIGTLLELLAKDASVWQPSPSTNGASIPTAEQFLDGDADEANSEADKKERKSAATAMVELALANGAKLYRDPAGECFADLPINGHRETHRLRTKALRRWIAKLFFDATEKAPGSQAVADALGTLEGLAAFGKEVREVSLRVGGDDSTIYIDLGDPAWRAVEVTADGWEVVSEPPVRFRRPPGMLPLPEPARGGSVDLLRRFVNCRDDEWPLVVGWLLCALRPAGPYPILSIHGAQGSAKSTLARLLKSLVDPHEAELRCEPRDDRDLAVSSVSSWALGIDNISSLPTWLSDGLCRIATGQAFSTRTLYSDDDETVLKACRPLLLTGIENFVVRGDLASRTTPITLSPISEEDRRTERELADELEPILPQVLGALLDAVVVGLQRLPEVQRTLRRLPRMPDAAAWVEACSPALGWAPGTYLAALDRNAEDSTSNVLESSPLATAVVKFMAERTRWTGTATELLAVLTEQFYPNGQRPPKDWPATPEKTRNIIHRLQPDLLAAGVRLEFGQRMGNPSRARILTIERVGDKPSTPSTLSTTRSGSGFDGWTVPELNRPSADTRLSTPPVDGAPVDSPPPRPSTDCPPDRPPRNPHQSSGSDSVDGLDSPSPLCSSRVAGAPGEPAQAPQQPAPSSCEPSMNPHGPTDDGEIDEVRI